ncbi:hypothetical protein ABTK06_18940, partial [Acinetobacter baumannii]
VLGAVLEERNAGFRPIVAIGCASRTNRLIEEPDQIPRKFRIQNPDRLAGRYARQFLKEAGEQSRLKAFRI